MVPMGLMKYKNEIESKNPIDQSIKYYINTWRKHLGSNENLEFIAREYPEHITRKNLFNLASEAKSSGDVKDIVNLFLGTMIWAAC